MWNMLLNVVSDDGKPDFVVNAKFGVGEFILGFIIGVIATLLITICVSSIVKECRKIKQEKPNENYIKSDE